MYRPSDTTQHSFLDFNQPMGLHMNPDNRWVKLADSIPWDEFETKYAGLFPSGMGNVAKPLRMALGALIIQTKFQYSDRELVEQIAENPYLQYFIGPPSPGSSSKGESPEKETENKGTLTLDATCAPAHIRYPQDISLLNEAREFLEGMIGRFCRYYSLPLPRRYRRQAVQERQFGRAGICFTHLDRHSIFICQQIRYIIVFSIWCQQFKAIGKFCIQLESSFQIIYLKLSKS